MANIVASTQSSLNFLGLPNEVLYRITNFADRSDLKCLRLCCRRLGCIAEAKLFSKIVLVPHRASFKRLETVAFHRLSEYVRAVVYDPRVLLYDDVFSAWNAGNQGNLLLEDENIVRISKILGAFPQLDCVSIQGRGPDPNPSPPTFYRQLLSKTGGRMRLQWGGVEETIAVLFMALAACQASVRHLNVDGVRLYLFCPERNLIPDRVFTLICSSLCSLRLWFDCIPILASNSLAAQNRAVWFLNQARQLEHLSLSSMDLVSWNLVTQHLPDLSGIIDRGAPESFLLGRTLHLSCLETLEIHTHWTTSRQWLAFLEAVSPTLRFLKLGNTALFDEAPGQPPSLKPLAERCWVSVLSSMRSILKLRRIEIFGVLAGAQGQRFEVLHGEQHEVKPNPGSESSVKSRVLDWFLNGSPCPLNEASVEKHFMLLLNDRSARKIWTGDDSWKVSWIQPDA